MKITNELKEQIITLAKQGYFADADNYLVRSFDAVFTDGKFMVSFYEDDEEGEEENCYTYQDYIDDEVDRAYKEKKIDEMIERMEG